ncbi:MAG: hypothetical protein M1818_000602 [Claussenomyces sp. TS43310]|nr:MAG: hypothetical protein M1818_000602 [Claussenomyces sp. TS43310]
MPPTLSNIKKVLVANRGEIAVRLIRACAKVGIKSVSIYTHSDATSLHASLADENVLLAGDNANGYLNVTEILQICSRLHVDAVIPGYGFLSENTAFAQAVMDVGMVFIGPSPSSVADMGQKHRARNVATSAGVPVVPGTGLLQSEEEAVERAQGLGFPIMLKATGGGGGMGLQVCQDVEEVVAAFDKVKSRGETLFGNSGIFLEKYYPESHHVEVQVFGNGIDVVIEECPSPFVEKRPGMRDAITKCAVAYASKLKYKSAGTVEFLVDDVTGDFFFLEMNTRLQVEHGITELCYDVDLVALMLQQADYEMGGDVGIPSEYLKSLQKTSPNGVSVEVRVYAEMPYRNYAPSPGLLQAVHWPEGEGLRVDTWVETGQRIAPYYDPLIAKLMVHDADRPAAIAKMLQILSDTTLQGPATNIQFLSHVVASDSFREGVTLTNFLDTRFHYEPCAIDVLAPGAFTTIQDYPARKTCGHGIPTGGPMDNISSRIANLLVGNKPGMELLEMTLSGPELLFRAPAVFSVCGAPMLVSIDGEKKPMWSRLVIQAGQKLKVGAIEEGGCRSYLAIKGGFPEIPYYLGSKSGTPSLGFGGTQGRQLQMGDWIELDPDTKKWAADVNAVYTLPPDSVPSYNITEIYCMHGPHDSDDFMTRKDREMLYGTSWKIDHNSNRTGVRLVGPVPEWSRKDGGEGGSHPSNIFDYGYPSPGGINWGGDSPVVFSMDSPDLGGLLCSTTVVSADLWRLGQVKPGDSLMLRPVKFECALELSKRTEVFIDEVRSFIDGKSNSVPRLNFHISDTGLAHGESNAVLKRVPGDGEKRPQVVYRQGGDSFMIVEIGKQTVDIMVSSRVRLLAERLQALNIKNLVMNQNVGSVTVQFDPKVIIQQELLQCIHEIESSIEANADIKIACREIHLPIVFDHPALYESTVRYMETNRPNATYLPDNIEYLRQNNGLSTRREVFDTALKAPFLVVAVGFLVGTPILFPLSPASGIKAQKYNPTRVSTPGGTIGMGGSLFAIYPIEAPGGYMLFARTLECWDTFGTKPGFAPHRPWLFEPFDLIRYYEVSVAEYDTLLRDFHSGRYQFDIRPATFHPQDFVKLFRAAPDDAQIRAFHAAQNQGMAERLAVENALYRDWVVEREVQRDADAARLQSMLESGAESAITIDSPMNANVWKVLVQPGDVLREGEVVAILEAMKMEINVLCPPDAAGARVEAIASKPGTVVSPGARLVVAKK